MAIRSFKGKWAAPIFRDQIPRGYPPDLVAVTRRKLMMVDQARQLGDLASPRANRLEMLKGDRRGQHSIRINDQWRVCFIWRNGHAEEVEVVDYH
jgi:proteic killer suppression protein